MEIETLRDENALLKEDLARMITNYETCSEISDSLRKVNAELNIILFHRDNGLSHPDLQEAINKSELIELRAENAELKAEIERTKK